MLDPSASDADLLAALRGGDDAALEALLRRHAPTVMRFALKLCRDRTDADDVLQDTLIAASRGLRELRGDAAVSTWLYTVARSVCIKKRRLRKHAPASVIALEGPEAAVIRSELAEPDDAVAGRQLGVALERAIGQLDEGAREVVVLRDVEGLSAAETAEVLGLSPEAVKSRLHRARASLRVSLAPLVSPPEPTVPSDPACPDIVDALSRHLEGDLGAEACAAMEAHMAQCSSCSRACTSLRSALTLCRTSQAGPLDRDAAERVRLTVERVLGA